MTAPSRPIESVDLAVTPLRELNPRLHDAPSGAPRWRVVQPERRARRRGRDRRRGRGRRSTGHVGYYCAGMNKLATVRVHGNAGVGLAENIMSGTVVVDGYAGQSRRRHRARRAGGRARRRVGALRDLDEGRRHRGRTARSATSSALHGPEGRARRLRRRGRGARRLDLRGAPLRARRASPALGADCVEKEMRDEHRAELARAARARRGATPTPATSAATARRARLYNFDVDNAGVLMTEFDASQGGLDRARRRWRPGCASRPSSTATRSHEIQRDGARGDLRHPRLGREAPRAALRRPAVPRRERLALPARGLPRALRHRRHARRPLRERAARAGDPDHDRRDELRRALGAGQGGARARRDRDGHRDDDRRRRHAAGGARALRARSSTSSCPRATG